MDLSLSLLILFCVFSAVLLDNANASLHVDAVIDPLSPSGQKLASLLRILSKYVQPSMRIVLNPMVSKIKISLEHFPYIS